MFSLSVFPRARKADLILQSVESEVVIYDLRTNRAMHLNTQLSQVWKLCDGKTSVSEVVELISARTGGPATLEFVQLALEELKERDLLVGVEAVGENSSGMTRREMLKKACVASLVVLPALSAITVPTPAAAMSLMCTGNNNAMDEPDGCPCTAATDCLNACCGPRIAGARVCVAPGSIATGMPCDAICNCASGCCGPGSLGNRICIVPGSIAVGQPCRADCNCTNAMPGTGMCTGGVCV